MSRVLKATLSLLASGLLLFAGVNYWVIPRVGASDFTPPPRFGIARPTTAFGPGNPVGIAGARVTKDNSFQVMINSSRCAAVSEVTASESETDVNVMVKTARVPGDCRASVYQWFVVVKLNEPLGERRVFGRGEDGDSTAIDVADCRAKNKGICLFEPIT